MSIVTGPEEGTECQSCHLPIVIASHERSGCEIEAKRAINDWLTHVCDRNSIDWPN